MTSGYSCGRINSKAECEKAVRELFGYGPETVASEKNVSEFPPYCYLYLPGDIGNELWFNSNGTSLSPCRSDQICVCTSASES